MWCVLFTRFDDALVQCVTWDTEDAAEEYFWYLARRVEIKQVTIWRAEALFAPDHP